MWRSLFQKQKIALLFVMAFMLSVLNLTAQSRFPIPQPQGVDSLSSNLSRISYLLHNPARDTNEVRVLIYGQSISEQKWWLEVKEFLEKRFPLTTVVVKNFAIGGFSSDRLHLMALHDIVEFYPDLIIFHDYGNEADYEDIIRTIRSNTIAEMMLQTDHISSGQDPEWHDKHSNSWLPSICKKYGLALVDVRSAWKAYLAANQLNANELLVDGVHLNDHGNYLMAGIVKNYLARLDSNSMPQYQPFQSFQKGKGLKGTNNKIKIPFVGNRVVCMIQQPGSDIQVLIDGHRPSELSETYYVERPKLETDSGNFFRRIGQLLRVDAAQHVQEEQWSITIEKVDTLTGIIDFSVLGSATGADGKGQSDKTFISDSHRISIQPEYWFKRRNANDFAKYEWLKKGDLITVSIRAGGIDKIASDPGNVIIYCGGANKSHELILSGKEIDRIKEVRIYRSPL